MDVELLAEGGRVAVGAPLGGGEHPRHHEAVHLLGRVGPGQVHHAGPDPVTVQDPPEGVVSPVAVAVRRDTVSVASEKVEVTEPPRVLPRHHARPRGDRDGGYRRLEDAPSSLVHQPLEVGEPAAIRHGHNDVEGRTVDSEHEHPLRGIRLLAIIGTVRHIHIGFIN